MTTLTILFSVSLILVAFYDFKYMAVPLLLLIVTAVLSFLRLLFFNRTDKGLLYAGLNLTGCLAIVLLSILVLFLVKFKLFNPLNTLIGSGDLVFFPAVCFSFSPVNFILFFILSLAVILIFKPFLYRSKSHFPLAGGISVLMFVAILIGMLVHVNLYNDTYLLNLLYH